MNGDGSGMSTVTERVSFGRTPGMVPLRMNRPTSDDAPGVRPTSEDQFQSSRVQNERTN